MAEDGIVKSITGVVTAEADDGTRRILKVNDLVYSNEQIVTGDAGSIHIEFSNGEMMDLGHNASTSYDQQLEQADNSATQTDDAAMNDATALAGTDVQAIQTALLQGESYDPTDPTQGLPPPAAGETASTGPLEDDGYSIIQVDYQEPRLTPVNGFETTGITFEFGELPAELIQRAPDQQNAPIFSPPGETAPEFPVTDFFVHRETGDNGPLTLSENHAGWLGFSSDPAAGDMVTELVISGFPENTGDSSPDWSVLPFALVYDPAANYTLDFQGYTQTTAGWQVTVGVNGAGPGDKIQFLLNVTPNHNVDAQIPLQIQTSVSNSEGGFTASADVSLGIEGVVSPLVIQSASFNDILVTESDQLIQDNGTTTGGSSPSPVGSTIQPQMFIQTGLENDVTHSGNDVV